VSSRAFARDYGEALGRFVEERSERRLQTAYELGRTAVQTGLGVLEVAAAHTRALAAIVEESGPHAILDVVTSAGDFLVESLAAFEMVQRGVTDARREAFEERRRARMLRELSSVLADAGIADVAPDSVSELAQLVAEIAREATGASEAHVVLQTQWARGDVTATAEEPEVDTWSELLQPISSHDAAAEEPGSVESASETIRALDGKPVGTLEVRAGARGLRQDDRATVVQIAQMTGAWLERAQRQRA
jgi:hypothetical protein